MNTIKFLRDMQKENRNPGHELGTFLLKHSNSLEYLVSQLEAYLAAAKADLDEEKAMFKRLFKKEST